jgi:hypothetical protein
MEESTTTITIEETEIIEIPQNNDYTNPDNVITDYSEFPAIMTTTSSSSDPTIDVILDDYFSLFPTSYLLLLVGIGISVILIYTLYNYLDQ